MRNIVFLVIILAFASCSFAPKHQRPEIADELGKDYANSTTKTASHNQAIKQWWLGFGNSELNHDIEQLLQQNYTLKSATARIKQARSAVDIQTASLLPNLNLNASKTKSYAPVTSRFSDVVQDRKIHTTLHNLEFSTAWQLDLFGKNRNSRKSATEAMNATKADSIAISHSLIAELVSTRIALETNNAQLKLAEATSNNRGKLAKILKRRYERGSGQSTNTNKLLLAEEAALNAQNDVQRIKRTIAELESKYNILLGQRPGRKMKFTESLTNKVLPSMPKMLPAMLLDHRPDLLASELRTKAANADIGIAIADLLPDFSLTGTLGWSSDRASKLLTSSTESRSITGLIGTRIFQGGALKANIALQKAKAEELTAVYSANILQAVGEVEVAMHNEKMLLLEKSSAQITANKLKKAEKISQARYNRGIENIRTFLDTKTRLYSSERNLLALEQQLWQNRVALYLALGGSWIDNRTQK